MEVMPLLTLIAGAQAGSLGMSFVWIVGPSRLLRSQAIYPSHRSTRH